MGNRELGRIGEQAAAELLQMEGYEILATKLPVSGRGDRSDRCKGKRSELCRGENQAKRSLRKTV